MPRSRYYSTPRREESKKGESMCGWISVSKNTQNTDMPETNWEEERNNDTNNNNLNTTNTAPPRMDGWMDGWVGG
jgi:hypothetical protein